MRKRLMSIAHGNGAVRRALGLLDSLVPSAEGVCAVLTFHRLETHQADLYPGLAGLDVEAFERFVDELATRCRPLGIDELLVALAGDGRLAPGSVLLTFDDAYRDFAEFAWPIMRRRDLEPVLFVPTSYPDAPSLRFWWDELFGAFASNGPDAWRRHGIEAADADAAFRAVRDDIKAMPHDEAMRRVRDLVGDATGVDPETQPDRVLGWAELAELGDQGVALAPHSRTHPMLDRLPADQLEGEIRGSYDDMVERLGADRVKNVFAYPAGGHDAGVRAAVDRAGFAAAFTTERGLVDVARSDHLRLPRLNVGRSRSVESITAEVAIRRARVVARRASNLRPG